MGVHCGVYKVGVYGGVYMVGVYEFTFDPWTSILRIIDERLMV